MLFGSEDENYPRLGWGAEAKVALGRRSSNIMARGRGKEMIRGTDRGGRGGGGGGMAEGKIGAEV